MRSRKFSSAHILASIALFASFGGSSFAAGKYLVTGRDIQNSTVTGADLRDGSVQESDLSPLVQDKLDGTLCEAGSDACDGDTGPAGTIPSGETVRGVFGGRMMPSQNAYVQWSVSLPGIAPDALTDDMVNAAPSALARDADEECTGSAKNPTAPKGKVCLYLVYADGYATELRGYGHTKYGFVVDALIGPRNGPAGVYGTWAYTAP